MALKNVNSCYNHSELFSVQYIATPLVKEWLPNDDRFCRFKLGCIALSLNSIFGDITQSDSTIRTVAKTIPITITHCTIGVCDFDVSSKVNLNVQESICEQVRKDIDTCEADSEKFPYDIEVKVANSSITQSIKFTASIDTSAVDLKTVTIQANIPVVVTGGRTLVVTLSNGVELTFAPNSLLSDTKTFDLEGIEYTPIVDRWFVEWHDRIAKDGANGADGNSIFTIQESGVLNQTGTYPLSSLPSRGKPLDVAISSNALMGRITAVTGTSFSVFWTTNAKGNKGDKGDKGDKGGKGADGRDGVDGIDGRDGTDGRNGVDGRDGQRGPQGIQGVQGNAGLNGVDGQDGADGVGVPSRGTTNQILVKASNDDYDTRWVNLADLSS